jgi:hypothetical protein
MSFSLEEVTPKENAWFSPNVGYEGMGRAEFADSRGAAGGDVRVLFDEFGCCSAHMVVNRVDSTYPLMDGVDQTHPLRDRIHGLAASTILPHPDGPILEYSAISNPCSRLTVETPAGVFSSAGRIDYRLGSATDGEHIDFDLWCSEFECRGAMPAKYWVMPLMNFLSGFCLGPNVVDRHPLRIFPTPAIPQGLTGTELWQASSYANSRNGVIVFTFNGSPAFIEPLADYDERERKLNGGSVKALATAIVVGEVGANSIEASSLKSWFPYDLLRVLGFAAGAEVGALWIEFRDVSGRLVRRIHERHGLTIFDEGHREGHRTIREGVHRGTGRLMTCFLSSEYACNSHLPVAMKHATQGGQYSRLTMEEKLIYVIRGLECLCMHFGLTEQYPDKRLKPENRELVRKILQNAAKEIWSIARVAKTPEDEQEYCALSEIAKRVKTTPWGKTGHFGLAVVDLLNKFGLPDAIIVDSHYAKKAPPGEVAPTWASYLSHLRGASLHEGFFDISSGEFGVQDIVVANNHLHDLLVRIILKMINYDGAYQPTVIIGATSQPVDWVQPTMSAEKLGYQ